MKNCNIRIPLLLGAGLLLIAGLAAANEPSTEPAYRLDEIVVTAENRRVERLETASVVTAEDLRSSGARTLDVAITLLPGVTIRTGGDGTPRIDIRGFRTRHVPLLLNGSPFNGTADGQFDPAAIPVEHIAEIRLVRGASSVLYGPGGNGGVINIITKQGGKSLAGFSGDGAGGEDARLGRFTLSHGTYTVTGFLAGSRSSRDGFPVSGDFTATAQEDGGQRENSDRVQENLFTGLNFHPSDATEIGLTLNYLGGERGKPPIVNPSNTDPFANTSARYKREEDSRGRDV